MISPETWDRAHLEGSLAMLGDTKAEDYARIFERVRWFEPDAETPRVLEVGPGLGRWLASLPPGIDKYAIDISPVNRERLKACTRVYAPGDEALDHLHDVDFAVALSVLQHCEDDQVLDLFCDVYAALHEGGSFFVNGIVLHHGFDFAAGGISVSRPLDSLIRLAVHSGFIVADAFQTPVPGLHIDHWVAYLEPR